MRREEVKRLVRRACKLLHFDGIFQQHQQEGETSSGTKKQIITTNDGEPIHLEWRWATRLDEADAAWAFDLFKRNMREMYLKSQWGYDEWSKREELSATTARFLLARNLDGRSVAYAHFRFVEDEGRPVLYCYEIQVEPDYQQKGIGARLIEQLERLAEGTQMELLMATVFAFNGPSLAFFHKRGFRSDSSCRFGQDGPGGRDYVILSKHSAAAACSSFSPTVKQQQRGDAAGHCNNNGHNSGIGTVQQSATSGNSGGEKGKWRRKK